MILRKILIAFICTLVLMFGTVMNVSAEISPSGQKDTTVTIDKEEKSPKTGESNLLFYGIAAMVILGGTAVVSKKRLENLK